MSQEKKKTLFEPEMPIVPNNWKVLPFVKAAKVISDQGKRLKQRDYMIDGKIPVIDQGQDFIGGYTDNEEMTFDGELPVILFGDHTRSIKFVNMLFVVGAEGIKILKPEPSYEPKFFYYLLKSLKIPSRGYSRHFQFLKKFFLAIAPHTEQKRIVAEIEKQSSRLDEAVANLKRVKANLKRYKASVLKAAVEGKLTEEWRKSNPDVEPADKLLERILAERRKKWEEAESAKMKAKGKEPKDDKWKKKYKEPSQVDETFLPILPTRWTWASILQISSDTQIGLVRSKAEQNNDENGVGYIKMNNVTMDCRVIEDNLVFVNADENEIKRFILKVGDILFNTRNSIELVGKVGLVNKNISDYIFNNNLMRIRVADGVNSSFIVFQMCSMHFRKKMERVKKATTNVAAIYAKDLMPLSIALPPSDEQIELSKVIEQHYSIIEEIETSLEANFKRAERLRQSLLKKAFSGKLVPQTIMMNP